ncbi:MAG: O-antigen ligase C-terminal domain-containing protein [Burkholderiaceae bacterium]|nr:O-antigen ligase C-terminal domain-containing protein [Burkholderiaceae bacterium]
MLSTSDELRPARSRVADLSQHLAAVAACAVAPMIGLSIQPSATVLNQVAAIAAWAAFALVLTFMHGRRDFSFAGARPVLGALGLLMAAALGSVMLTRLPPSLALASMGLLLAAGVLLLVGVAVSEAGQTESLMTSLCLGWLVLGVLLCLVCCVQVFVPAWADGDWIARSSLPGRAIGNMRQPNHVASLLLWSCVSLIWLHEAGRLPKAWVVALLGMFVLAVVLTASRMGMLGIFMLCAWGFLDRKLARFSQLVLRSTPLMLAVFWVLLSLWSQTGEHAFGAAARLTEGASSSSRGLIWANAWELVSLYPITGVGWGEFNLALSMTPISQRTSAFFDHTHNLPLQLLVELGFPLALTILGLLGWGLSSAVRSIRRTNGSLATALRCAGMMIVFVGLHSLLEYPLWYAYFLLPTALLLGLCIGSKANQAGGFASKWRLPISTLRLASAWVLVVGVATFVDYLRVVAIYTPSYVSLKERIERGQDAWLFGTLADYAYAAHFPLTKEALAAIKRTSHVVVDGRLMMLWASTLHATGDDERARYVAQRLREFRNPISDEWFAQCDLPVPVGQPKPFQCTPPTKVFTYRDML